VDIDKILEIAPKYLSEYFSVVVATITRPGTYFGPDAASIPLEQPSRGPQLSGQLFVFMIINALLGLTANALIPLRKAGPDIISSVVVVILYWFFYSTIAHWICKMLRGSGTYEKTLSVSLQVLSVLYLISSFFAFAVGAIVRTPEVADAFAKMGILAEAIVDNPASTFFLFQFLGLAVYLPLSLRRVHNFGKGRTGLLGVLAFIGAVVLLAILGTACAVATYRTAGVMLPPPPG
jgi:hypothetical protein